MRRIKLVIEYDGTNYAGWQRQKNALSIQEVIEGAIERITGERSSLHGAGRTDARVHALGQVAHFDTESRIESEKFAYALNAFLPKDIRVLESAVVDGNFHARFDAKLKRYRYCIHNAPHASALYRSTRLHVYRELDVEAMANAAVCLVGEHDFAAFQATGGHVKTTVREIYESSVTRDGELVKLDIVGNGFLYNMVRIIVGTLIEIGIGALEPNALEVALEGGIRGLAGPTAPANGLVLVEVVY